MNWFRLHHTFFSDPKLVTFNFQERHCLLVIYWQCSESTDRGTVRIDPDDWAGLWQTDVDSAQALLQRFHVKRLIALQPDGTVSVPSWNIRQASSDNSTERVRRYRQKITKPSNVTDGNVSETLHVTVDNGQDKIRVEKKRKDNTLSTQQSESAFSSSDHSTDQAPDQPAGSVISETDSVTDVKRYTAVSGVAPDRDTITMLMKSEGATQDDADDYWLLRDGDNWTKQNMHGNTVVVTNPFNDARLFARKRVKDRKERADRAQGDEQALHDYAWYLAEAQAGRGATVEMVEVDGVPRWKRKQTK